MARARRVISPSVAHAVGLLAVYVVVIVWRTWPLAAHVATHVPDAQFDALYPLWALAYETHALSTAPLRFADANIYHPATGTLFYGPIVMGVLPLFAPTFLATGNPFLALNLSFMGCVALTALGLHLVVRRWTGSAAGGFLAAWTVLTNAWLFAWVPRVPQYVSLFYLPWIALLASGTALGMRRAAIMVPLVVLQCLAEPIYIAPAILGPLGVLALGRLARRSSRGAGVRLLGVLALSGLLLLPIYAGYVTVRAENPALQEQSLWGGGELPPVLWLGWAGLSCSTFLPKECPANASVVTLGIILMGLGALALDRVRHRPAVSGWAPGALWTIVGLSLSAVRFRFFGRMPIAFPHMEAVVRYMPRFYPDRLGVAALMGFAMLTGVAIAQCAQRGRPGVRRPLAGALALLCASALYVERRSHLPSPFPIAPTQNLRPALLDALARTEGPLLELPVGGMPTSDLLEDRFQSALANARAMCRSMFHWRPLLNGYSSYWPRGFPERMALARRLPDAEALAALRRVSGLRVVLVRIRELQPSDRSAWLQLAANGGRTDLRLLAHGEDELLFDLPP